ncbi:Sensor histidine kinase DesK [Actinomadura rubteroloni]|uniref:Sensor histidine kinase DesK n=1 Tax=Actinomadura rubteroloni TaxID=1926885 RepID=A0A2P4UCA3_9ACTN|nr:sensor histidine kinase [Actinomadura rubteroloni]POM22676.1 Sensor histidine kinase DesK [Actinomadura rubteroloni]
MRRRPPLDLARIDGSGPDARGLSVWVVVLAWPASDVVSGSARPRWAAALLVAVVAVLFVATLRTAFDGRRPLRAAVLLLAAQTAATGAAIAWFGGHWLSALGVLGVAAGAVIGHLPRPRGGLEVPMFAGVGGVTAVATGSAWLGGLGTGGVAAAAWTTLTAGLVTTIVVRLFLVITLLRDAREELASAAVERERLRFSRDLHDLLGHTLSLMVVQAQAVRRIAERDPALAARQAADIETVGRDALGEVRQAVAGYRGRGLAAELDAARSALAAAGIEPVVRRSDDPLPPGADALLGWAVREGVTNVVRHSGARTCTITLEDDVLSIVDDGSATGTPSGGHGLRGLRERVADAGGSLTAGPRPGGGFALTVRLTTEVP